ncbi:uncharacterized protein QC763_0041240 [Podospora pseudopauciseta]|uniref:Uncharacterized protein n=2 Tax=Podospora TaxID=5144 RepID=A0ABR0HQS5_9PEZI|nr:hypothetical protein QC763_0041240 [Podospora pseudopauciseta]KAK4680134.1 hypothetical protein QC764_0041930 [Podospora pseudoanserina]
MRDSDGISNFAGHRSVGDGTVSQRQMKKFPPVPTGKGKGYKWSVQGAALGLDNPQNVAPMLMGLDAVAPKQATESTRDEAHARPTTRQKRNKDPSFSDAGQRG